MPQKATVDKLLAESFKELVAVTPVEKITIKEITDKAGVIRPTFIIIFRTNMNCWNGSSGRKFWTRSFPCFRAASSAKALHLPFRMSKRIRNSIKRRVRWKDRIPSVTSANNVLKNYSVSSSRSRLGRMPSFTTECRVNIWQNIMHSL